ncbi:MAG: bifunctional methylenetetrahydrofolate dehydrogenase/methenyltetrahydrofolate cyclohydrolase FolD [Bacteroidota bacterium]|nr:bifunctional methylenetetrahydrofolate dehydrogenase/methenyltetrahydrofolate cyclohydrolase FolD [Bacteroidota bacterium]
MSATILDGSAIASVMKEEIRRETAAFTARTGIRPGLAFLLVGDNPAALSYVASKERACAHCGFSSRTVRLPATSSLSDVLEYLDAWNIDPDVHGILVQLPLPAHISEERVINAITPRKDVDGFHPVNLGKLVLGQECFRPCTPAGIQELLIRSGVEISGRHVVVVGRSNIVGKPMAIMLMQKAAGANAVVTVAHTAAQDLGSVTRLADILIVAIGKPAAITADMVREGAVVIDVGINRVPDPDAPKGYRIQGDVDFEPVRLKASAMTPVPGGVGPMTIVMLMRNTLQAAYRATGSNDSPASRKG